MVYSVSCVLVLGITYGVLKSITAGGDREANGSLEAVSLFMLVAMAAVSAAFFPAVYRKHRNHQKNFGLVYMCDGCENTFRK